MPNTSRIAKAIATLVGLAMFSSSAFAEARVATPNLVLAAKIVQTYVCMAFANYYAQRLDQKSAIVTPNLSRKAGGLEEMTFGSLAHSNICGVIRFPSGSMYVLNNNDFLRANRAALKSVADTYAKIVTSNLEEILGGKYPVDLDLELFNSALRSFQAEVDAYYGDACHRQPELTGEDPFLYTTAGACVLAHLAVETASPMHMISVPSASGPNLEVMKRYYSDVLQAYSLFASWFSKAIEESFFRAEN